MAFVIRTFTPEDYGAFAHVFQRTQPDEDWTEQEFRDEDKTRPEHVAHQKFVAEVDGNIVGACLFEQRALTFHPRKYILDGGVLPEYEKNGIGTALLKHMIETLEQRDLEEIIAVGEERRPWAIEFFKKHGFEQAALSYESHLSLETYDPSPYEGLIEKLNQDGIEFKTYDELTDAPNHQRKMYDLWWTCKQDEPTVFGVMTKIDFEHYVNTRLSGPNFTPECHFIALDGDRYVGLTDFWHRKEGEYISIGFTCCHPDYRGRGIATALKVIGNEWAIKNGYKKIKTNNNSSNAPMLAINVKMGFDRQPAIVVLKKYYRS